MSTQDPTGFSNEVQKYVPPLRGIRVLDLTTVVAGPFSSMILSDFGADVIKLERLDGGDDSRGMGPHRDGWGAMFVPLNRGKRSIAINVTKPAGREVVLRLASTCDVFLENFRGGKATQLGLDEDAVRARAPKIIYASMSAFGTKGPDFMKPGYDGLIQGRTGIMSITGADAETTVRAGVSIIDMSAGMWLAMGVMAALYERERSGRGQRVDASLLQSGVMLMAYHLMYRQFAGENPEPQGTGHFSFAPYGAFRAADGKIMLGVSNDRVFKRFCTAMGRGDWAENPRFSTNVLRVQNRQELDAQIEAGLLTKTVCEWTAQFDKHDVPVSAIQTAEQVLKDPQVAAVEQLEAVDLPGGDHASALIPRLPVSLSVTRPRIAGRPPRLGEHGRDILLRAGYSDPEIDELLSTNLCALA
ncbi:MAG TPA: CoA transferase [Vicinamibacterales bacterium]|nr:CoA transferase [Vicinamibacterales bacterium]